MKRILLLIPALNAGGAERVMVTLANNWAKDNDVTIMVFNDGTCFYELSNKVKIIGMRLSPAKGKIMRALTIPFIEYKRYKTIYKEIKNNNYDIILSFCFTTNIMASVINKVLIGKNIIISERNDPNNYSKVVSFFINKFYKWSKCIVCQNIMVRDYFIERGFKNKLIVLPNPVNFDDIPQNRPAIIKKEIVNVGRLIPQKNQKLLIDAFIEIKDDYPDYVLKIYGIGPLENDLERYIKINNLEDRIFLMGTKKKVMHEVNKSSLFVLSSNFEGFPNVLIEAMATGLPVISSDFKTGIAKELIQDNNGYLFEVNNKEELIECLRKALNREKDFIKMGENNRIIAEKYKADVISKKWLFSIKTL